MSEIQNAKHYDLENRTLEYARQIRNFVRKLSRTIANIEDGKQVVRSSGSIGANYIEANEALSRKDFIMRVKISRKETKETEYWLQLVDIGSNRELEGERIRLIQEATELRKIFGSILEKSK